MIYCWKNVVNIKEGIGIGNEFLKIAGRVEPLIGSRDKLSYLILSFNKIKANLSDIFNFLFIFSKFKKKKS